MSERNADCLLRMRGVWTEQKTEGMRCRLEVPTLELVRGRFLVVVGATGGRKRALIDLLTFMAQPTGANEFSCLDINRVGAGCAVDVAGLWRDRDHAALSSLRSRLLGQPWVSSSLLPFLSVMENIQWPYEMLGTEDQARVRELARCLGISETLNRSIAFLSEHQRQRVLLIRALLHKPSVVLLDEPTTCMDRSQAELVFEELSTLASRDNVGVVLISRDRDLAQGRADQLLGFKTRHETDEQRISELIPLISARH
ncbi:MAG: ATP-binding cassette domain-containing protein [Gammaproteobacteria bacterium]